MSSCNNHGSLTNLWLHNDNHQLHFHRNSPRLQYKFHCQDIQDVWCKCHSWVHSIQECNGIGRVLCSIHVLNRNLLCIWDNHRMDPSNLGCIYKLREYHYSLHFDIQPWEYIDHNYLPSIPLRNWKVQKLHLPEILKIQSIYRFIRNFQLCHLTWNSTLSLHTKDSLSQIFFTTFQFQICKVDFWHESGQF